MITKDQILSSIKYVVDNSKYVHINEDNINKAINLLNTSENKKQSWLDSNNLDIKTLTQKEIIIYFILCESLNFSFWNSDIKWKIEFKKEWYSGSFGLFYAIEKAIKNGHNLLNIDYLENLTEKGLNEILKGTTTIPMLKERYKIIKQLAKELKQSNNFENITNSHTDIELLNNIINNFSNFRDISIYKGKEIYFFKRAILLVEDLSLNIDSLKENIKNIDNMIGCADYKIPQVLRHLGILEYSNSLAAIIDNKKELKHDSEMEIEIRANMLYAIELIKEKLHQKGINMNSLEIDNALWLLSKNKEYKEKPHHLTKTIYY